MRRNIEMDNTTSVVTEHNKDEQNFKPHGVDREEVDGSELRYVVIEERSPRL